MILQKRINYYMQCGFYISKQLFFLCIGCSQFFSLQYKSLETLRNTGCCLISLGLHLAEQPFFPEQCISLFLYSVYVCVFFIFIHFNLFVRVLFFCVHCTVFIICFSSFIFSHFEVYSCNHDFSFVLENICISICLYFRIFYMQKHFKVIL